ncbi:hypothetical protein J5500_03440 [Candidatus Saccharibacteria bacterium]|nr:hypothetical protein [Candidatus Saccharibacteria bacterium]
MPDSFDARMQGQTPESVKQKSGKGWMICSIILAILLIGGGVFAGMIIMKGDRDTNRLSEVEQQLKEKDEKIAELEKKIDEGAISSDPEGDQKSEEETESENNDDDDDGATYIKFSAAGMKIKIPNTLKSVNYTVNSHKDIVIWAVPAGFQYYPDFANPKKNTSGMAVVELSKKVSNKSQACNSSNVPDGLICTGTYVTDAAVKGYEILYESPHAVYSRDETSIKDESKAEQELIKVLSDKNNYSAL